MKIRGIEIGRPYLTLKGEDIEFLKNSINLIKGENGAGKTTLLEEIIFSDNIVEFGTEYEKELYEKNRSSLFSYVPQDIKVYKTSVLDYITKGNANVCDEDILDYFSMFSLSNIKLHDRFDTLSGGEKTKIAIISALVKDTPYVFLDEPTNHLDDDSVEVLKKILEEFAYSRTFIIVCHDERVVFENANVYTIAGNSLHCPSSMKAYGEQKNGGNTSSQIYDKFKTFRKKIIFNYTNLIVFYLFLSLMVFLIVVNDMRFTSGYSYDNGDFQENIILSYPAEYMYAETNQIYAKSENLLIEADKFEKMITYNDLHDISMMENVSKIRILDPTFFYEKLHAIMSNGSEQVNPAVFSMPEDFIKLFPDISYSYLSEFGELLEGRYPHDEKREICIPRKDIPLYGINNGSTINEWISVNGIRYQIVGILDNSKGLYLTSYEEAVNNGFYQYSPETFEGFKKNIINCSENTQELLIYTDEEKTTLNSLIESYPATNYNSYQFTKTFEKQYNKQFLLKEIIPINLFLSLVFGVIILLTKKNQLRIDQNIIYDYSVYYIDRKKIKRKYFKITIGLYALLAIGTVVSNTLFSKLSFASNPILIFDILIAFLPAVLFALWRNKNAV